MRNPKWHRDEIILALDLYFRIENGQMHSKNVEVIKLSEILNKLPIYINRPDAEKFRNSNGIAIKLGNFMAIDPDYSGKGMTSFSKLDKAVFMEFYKNKEDLHRIASQIKETTSSSETLNNLYYIPDDEDEENYKVKEGKVIYKLHKSIERNNKINIRKKKEYYIKNGKLDCEVCGFDFHEIYGKLGDGFIECHHRIPLHVIGNQTETSLDDLALVCPNCHRMLHRGINNTSLEESRDIIHK